MPRTSSFAARAARAPALAGAALTLCLALGAGPARAETVASPPYTLGAYAEIFYQWNFREPSNGITNFRGFDNRHNAFTIANVALDAQWDYERLLGRVTLQVGHTPSTYYASEPALPGASGANASGAELWKYLQQAHVGYRAPLGRGLTLAAGLFLSPIGPENMAVRDNWSWSRSTLFFGLPFYHTGVRATYPFTDEWSVTLAGYNGWNSVLDGNDEKSVSLQLLYTSTQVVLSALYFGGVERPKEAPEGRAFRHLFDAHVTWNASSWLSVLAHGNAGFEPNDLGTSLWAGGALYARARLAKPVYLAVRADVLYEEVARGPAGAASPLFFPAPWVSSRTVTLDVRPHERVSLRLELRSDRAAAPIYFGGAVASDASGAPAPTARSQDTVTLGATTWL